MRRPRGEERINVPAAARTIISLALLAGLCPPPATAEPRVEQKPPRFSTSLSIWESTGGSVWSHDASAADPLFGDPTSRLEYDGIDSTIVELRGRLELSDGLSAELAYGAGEAEDGRLTDEDFVSARGAEFFDTATAGVHAYSETRSGLNGDAVRYVELRLARALHQPPGGGSRAGLAARYLYWMEQYRVTGVSQTVCTAPNRLCAPAGTFRFRGRDVVLNEARWHALFIGIWGERDVTNRFRISGELSYSPLVALSSDDRHFLRSDLAQSPSFRLEGNGQAAAVRLDAAYRLTPRLAAALGLRYWWAAVTDEMRGFTAFPASEAPFSAPLNRFETDRYGVTASIVYDF